MEIECGEYVRLEYGRIDKVKNNDYYMQQYIECEEGLYPRENIVKHSKNIIDLVEPGDYVNGHKIVSEIWGEDDNDLYFEIEGGFGKASYVGEKSIKTIVTKEQMSSIEYKVEEDK